MKKRTSAPSYIVGRQKVRPSKIKLAKTLRKHLTLAELTLWRQLRTNKLGGIHFRRQQIIGGFIADFYCHQSKLVIEIDGQVHETQKDYDIDRDAALKQRGLRIIRFSNREIIRDIGKVLLQIEEACKQNT